MGLGAGCDAEDDERSAAWARLLLQSDAHNLRGPGLMGPELKSSKARLSKASLLRRLGLRAKKTLFWSLYRR